MTPAALPPSSTAAAILVHLAIFEDYYRRTWDDVAGDLSSNQTDHATALRVPLLTSGSPEWNFVTGIVVVNDGGADRGIMSTDDQVDQVAQYLTELHRPQPRPSRTHRRRLGSNGRPTALTPWHLLPYPRNGPAATETAASPSLSSGSRRK